MNIIFGLGFILLVGILAAKLVNKIKFPAVTGYLIIGIVIGSSILDLLPKEILDASGLISNIVLGIIAFGIGQNFSKDTFKKIGRSVIWISILEACGAWILVTLVFLVILRQPFYLALLFGAIASATAPAATVMVVNEYHARGNFTDTLLGVVAIDDAWCLIIFAISLAISRAIFNNMIAPSFLLKVFFKSFLSIVVAFFVGMAIAWAIYYIHRFVHTQSDLLIFTLGFVFLNIGIAIFLNASILLSTMFTGAILVNIDPSSYMFFDSLKGIDPPLFLIFFVLAGANLEVWILSKLGLIGLAYIIFRIIGKMGGAWIGAYISNADERIQRYLGIALVPQAGVALGCALIAKSDFPSVGNMIFSTVVATTVIYELVGPVCTKIALKKAGEIEEGDRIKA